jgi:hypothetical protein
MVTIQEQAVGRSINPKTIESVHNEPTSTDSHRIRVVFLLEAHFTHQIQLTSYNAKHRK